MPGNDINPYESPAASTETPRAGLLSRIGCLLFFVIGGGFVLSLVGEALFGLLFLQKPKHEPHFAPIPVEQSEGQP